MTQSPSQPRSAASVPDPPVLDRSSGTEPVAYDRFAFTESLKSHAARGTLINTAFMVGIGLLGLLKGFILAGFLTPSDYGVWGILAASLSTLVWLKQAGVGDKFVQQDEPDQELAFQRAFTLELIVSLACVALVLIAIPLLVLIYSLPRLAAPSIVVAAALLATAFQAPLWIYYRSMEFRRQRALQSIDPVVGFVVSIALAIAGAGYWAFVGGLAAGALASAIAAVLSSPYELRLRFERQSLRSYWSFSGPLLIGSGAIFVMAWSALITAKLALGVAAVGVIALADNIASFTERLDELVTGSLYPAICAVKDRTSVLYESLVKSNRLALMWAVPFGVGISLFSSDLVRFGIGARWQPAITVLEIYGLAAAFNHIGFNWGAYFRAIGRTRPMAIESTIATVVFLLTGIPLLVLIGLNGFAIGIAMQTVAAVVVRAYYLQRLFPALDFLRHAARAFLPTVPAAGVVLLIRGLGPRTHSLGLALAELAVYVGVDMAAAWWLESSLLREAAGYVLRRPGTVAVSLAGRSS